MLRARCAPLMVVGFTVFFACGEPVSHDGVDCSHIEDPCETRHEEACDEDRILRCSRDADGCLEWEELDRCGARENCEESAGAASCFCEDECDRGGERRCDGDLVHECSADLDGCLYWEGRQNCAATGQSCDESGDEAECVGCPGDHCDDPGARRCQRQVIQACELQDDGCLDWEPVRNCADDDPPRFCSESDDRAECVDECTNNCDEAGLVRCVGVVLETCVAQDYGCLDWEDSTDCSVDADYCDDSSGEATCIACDHGCGATTDTRCTMSVVETCTADENGCRAWVAGEDCSTMDPVNLCDVVDGTATCVELPATGACATPIVVDEAHYVLMGVDFTSDFENDHTWTGADCESHDATAEVVFAIDLSSGQTIRVRELGDLDVIVSLQLTCGDTETCVFSEDSLALEIGGNDYTATEDGRVFVIVEAWDAEPRTLAYDIRIDTVETEVCDNEIDDDADGVGDCDDDDCFGEGACATAELNCADGGDNDDDGATDCDDTDCTTDRNCEPYRAIYELGGLPWDVEYRHIIFTPDGAAVNGFTWSDFTITDFPVLPGSGTATSSVEMGDDDAEAIVFALMPSFPYFGESYSSLYINSNGYLTFEDWGVSAIFELSDFFEFPAIAGLMTNLAPDLPSTDGDPEITVDEFADRIVVSFVDVPYKYAVVGAPVEDPNDVQIILNSDGSIELAFLEVNAYDALIGLNNGYGLGDYPDPVDLIE